MLSLQETATYAAVFVAVELSRYLAFALAWSGLLWSGGRRTAARKIQRPRLTRAGFSRDARASVVSVVVYAAVGVVTVQLITMGYLKWVAWPGLGLFIATCVATIIAHDAYFYWTHRWMHHRKLFRRMHADHHRAKTPTVWTSYSFAMSEAAVQALFIPVWIVLVPMDDVALLVFFVHQLSRNIVGHSGYELAWPGFTRSRLTGWLTTTTHHDLHHSEGAHNFGLYFTWWDRLMGTEHPDYHARFDAAAKRYSPIRSPGAAGHGVIGSS